MAAAVAQSLKEEKKRKKQGKRETEEEEQIRIAIEASQHSYQAEQARG
jgi:hypothetical protein|tara:strand:+ start:312 stop:455 length:144 start_codon:yes stop_codon:yes gene_type:complete